MTNPLKRTTPKARNKEQSSLFRLKRRDALDRNLIFVVVRCEGVAREGRAEVDSDRVQRLALRQSPVARIRRGHCGCSQSRNAGAGAARAAFRCRGLATAPAGFSLLLSWEGPLANPHDRTRQMKRCDDNISIADA